MVGLLFLNDLKLLRRFLSLIIVYSSIMASWTAFGLFTKSSYDKEINSLLKEMYNHQLSIIENLKDLSILLVKETYEIVSVKKQPNTSKNKLDKKKYTKSKLKSYIEPISIEIEAYKSYSYNE